MKMYINSCDFYTILSYTTMNFNVLLSRIQRLIYAQSANHFSM